MIENRRRAILTLFSGILIVLILLLVWLFSHREKTATQIPVPTPIETEEPAPVPADVQKEVQQRQENSSVEVLAKTFAARYGSYSSESSFANLSDLYPLMTAGMQASTEAFIASTKLSPEFYGVTTRVISLNVKSNDKTSAIVAVSTQREETKENVAPVVRYQTLTLQLVFQSGTWKVDSAIWE